MTETLLFSYPITLLVLCPLIFLAAFVDSIAGGGGLISLPAYLFIGLPIHTAHGTNKFTATTGLLTAVVNYIRGGCVDFPAAISGGIAALIGSFFGTYLALSLSPYALQISLMVILPLAGIIVFARQSVERLLQGRKKISSNEQTNVPINEIQKKLSFRQKMIVCCLIGLVFGCYDGFFGPGAGMFMTMGLSALAGLELVKASGTARVVNFSSNIASTATWMINGRIYFPLTIPCMICAVTGAYLGSRMAMKVGKRLIKAILVIVSFLLFVKILFDLINVR